LTAGPSPEVTLRVATPSDRDFLAELYGSTRSEELAQVAWSEAEKRAFLLMQFEAQSRAYAEYQNAVQSIILAGGQPAGRLYVARWPDEIRVVDISIVAALRGRGIGTALLRLLIEEGRESGRPVGIHVERFSRALRLYSRLGFETAADKGVYLYLQRRP
jgi:RimJ/RimL family protein N-acetyltransferase